MNIKNNRIILKVSAMLALCGFSGACSNMEEGFHVADRSDLTLTISPQSTQSGGTSSSTQNLSIINAVNGGDKVYVNSQANWKVEVLSDEKPESHSEWTLYIDEIVNDGNESYFTYSSSINIRDQREWPRAFKIYVEGNDGEELVPQYLTVRQDRSVLLPSPTSFEIFPASGGGGTINIESTGDWSVVSNAENTTALPEGWISIDRSRMREGVVTFSVLSNRGTSVRTSSIEFLDGTGKTVTEINISQSESKNTFDAYVSRGGELISQNGAELEVNVLSDKGWKVECAQAGVNGWLIIDGLGQNQPASTGSGDGIGKRITVTVAPNSDQSNREATLVFSRTEDAATDNQGGVAPISIKITQSGTRQPALSTPWIEGEYSQKSVAIYARYFCDTASTGGIEIRNVSKGGDFVAIPNMSGEAESVGSGIIHVILTSEGDYNGLKYIAGNEYEMRTYLNTDYGLRTSSSVTFSAPGIKPGNDDQEKPGVN